MIISARTALLCAERKQIPLSLSNKKNETGASSSGRIHSNPNDRVVGRQTHRRNKSARNETELNGPFVIPVPPLVQRHSVAYAKPSNASQYFSSGRPILVVSI